jgi:hypothetical protein
MIDDKALDFVTACLGAFVFIGSPADPAFTIRPTPPHQGDGARCPPTVPSTFSSCRAPQAPDDRRTRNIAPGRKYATIGRGFEGHRNPVEGTSLDFLADLTGSDQTSAYSVMTTCASVAVFRLSGLDAETGRFSLTSAVT